MTAMERIEALERDIQHLRLAIAELSVASAIMCGVLIEAGLKVPGTDAPKPVSTWRRESTH